MIPRRTPVGVNKKNFPCCCGGRERGSRDGGGGFTVIDKAFFVLRGVRHLCPLLLLYDLAGNSDDGNAHAYGVGNNDSLMEL